MWSSWGNVDPHPDQPKSECDPQPAECCAECCGKVDPQPAECCGNVDPPQDQLKSESDPQPAECCGKVDPLPDELTLESHTEPAEIVTYTMYHGTSKEAAASIMIDGFRLSRDGILGPGIYLSWDLETASKYPLGLPDSEKVVLKVKAKVGKILFIDRPGHPLLKTWTCCDYTALCSPDFSKNTDELVICICNPDQLTVSEVISPPPNKFLAGAGCPAYTDLESLVAPIEGKVYTMYHGTSREAAASILREGFRPSIDGLLGPGVYVSRDIHNASRYPVELAESERVVLKVRVDVGKVLLVDHPEHLLMKAWACQGYNMACYPIDIGKEEDCVWNPRRLQVIGVICSRSQLRAKDESPPLTEPLLGSHEKPIDGRVYTMYHGTSREAALNILKEGFEPSTYGNLGVGIYLHRDLQKARRYPLGLPDSEKVVLRLRVEVGRVIVIDCPEHPLQQSWACQHYNMAWCPPEVGTLEEDCIWNPRRIQVTGVFTSNEHGLWMENESLLPVESTLESGKIRTMYHGTSKAAALNIMREGFTKYLGSLKGHVNFSLDQEKAKEYPKDLPMYERAVLKMTVRVAKGYDYKSQTLKKAWNTYKYERARCGVAKNGLKVMAVY